ADQALQGLVLFGRGHDLQRSPVVRDPATVLPQILEESQEGLPADVLQYHVVLLWRENFAHERILPGASWISKRKLGQTGDAPGTAPLLKKAAAPAGPCR